MEGEGDGSCDTDGCIVVVGTSEGIWVGFLVGAGEGEVEGETVGSVVG